MKNDALNAWVRSIAAHTRPSRIHWCDGTDAEIETLERQMVESGTFLPLNPEKHPHSYLHRSSPTDVARTEHLTFICSERPEDAGPTNNWLRPEDARARAWPLFEGAMQGRTMYVVPYLMGPVGSRFSKVGIELTDSPYVVANMRIMTRMGNVALEQLGASDDFVRGLHSLGDLSPERRYIMHFPETRTIWSIGSGYGGNALLGKKCHALRLASVQGRAEGWMAEHMLIMGITAPSGRTHYVAAAFPSACGKTNLALLVPTLPGYTVETVGDDICWMHPGEDGRLWAINPEAGMFGVAPNTSFKTNPNAMRCLDHDVIFTNVALRKDGTPWWEGMDDDPGDGVVDWRGLPWSRGAGEKAAHPNSRFTVATRQCPSAGAGFDDPRGVPISAIVFGGRRARVAPLVYEATSWEHGVYVGATMVSETTAAATGAVGVPRNDPMAMLPFCGYNMGDYFRHWLCMGERLENPPKIFHVNWFRTQPEGGFLWPGYGENIRVLKWMIERIEGKGMARPSPIGLVPEDGALDLSGLAVTSEQARLLLEVDVGAWKEEVERNSRFLDTFGDRLPQAVRREHEALSRRLG
jgi:phosphoenolpyruvate carboxykinase (GTP)